MFCIAELDAARKSLSKYLVDVTVAGPGVVKATLELPPGTSLPAWCAKLAEIYSIEKVQVLLGNPAPGPPLAGQRPRGTDRHPRKRGGFNKALKRSQEARVREWLGTACHQLSRIWEPASVSIVTNVPRVWPKFSQREVQALARGALQNALPDTPFLLKGGEGTLRVILKGGGAHFSASFVPPRPLILPHVHPTPVRPGIAWAMIQLGSRHVPRARVFIDAMTGGGTLAIMLARLVEKWYAKEVRGAFVGAFDADPAWVTRARTNAGATGARGVEFQAWDVTSSLPWPFPACDLAFAHPPFGHFVKIPEDHLQAIYHGLCTGFARAGRQSAGMVINTPRWDLLEPAVAATGLRRVDHLAIPRAGERTQLHVVQK